MVFWVINQLGDQDLYLDETPSLFKIDFDKVMFWKAVGKSKEDF